MHTKRLFVGLLALLLTACNLPRATQPVSPSATETQTLPPGVTPTVTPSPTLTPSPTPTPEVRLKTGDQAYFNGDLKIAESEYQDAYASTTDPQMRAAALWGMGQIAYAVGNNGKALEDFQNLASNYPDAPNAARAYFIMGDIYTKLERYTEAVNAYTTYLSLRPGVIDYYVQERLGDAQNVLKNYAEAIEAYQAALVTPHIGDDTALQLKIAQAYIDSGDTTTALAKYDALAASSSANDYTKAQVDLLEGRIYLSLGQTDEAYQRFLHAVENYPTSYDSYSALVVLVNADVQVDQMDRGLVDYFAGQYGYALEAFRNYNAANPDNDGTAYFYLAMTLNQLGQYQEAVDAFTDFISRFPGNSYWQRAWDEKAYILWADLGQYEAAAQTLLDYVNADSGNSYAPQAMLTAGQIYERGGSLDDAANVWNSIADDYPSSELVPQALFLAGIALYRNAEYDKALLSFQRDTLLSTETDDQARAFFWIGKTQQALDDSASAQSSWQQAASLDTTDYYSLRAQDMLLHRSAFDLPAATDLTIDWAAERAQAETWLRVTLGMSKEYADLSAPGDLLEEPRLTRGTELWKLGLKDEARLEFEDLRGAVQEDAAYSYRLMNYLLDLGLYRPAITAARQVLTLAGMSTQLETLAAPKYFNHIRYGLYYQDLIFPAAQSSGFDALFLFSVVRQESLFEGFVQSTAGARGLMQIVPSTGQYIVESFGWPTDYTDADLYLPIVSINLGANYMMSNRTYFDGDLYATLAAYNGGPSNAEAWRNLSGDDPDLFLEVIRYQETRDYIRSIYENYSMYESLYGPLS